jgi:hypothetical protein
MSSPAMPTGVNKHGGLHSEGGPIRCSAAVSELPDRPVGGHPFPGVLNTGWLEGASLLVDRSGLNHGYFLLAETLSDQVESC